MPTGAITGYIDVAQLVLYGFWIFFAGLIFYLRREDKREGYPLESDRSDRSPRMRVVGFPTPPEPKQFLLPHGQGTRQAPHAEARAGAIRGAATDTPWNGSPLIPTGDPLRDGVGPGSYADREDSPDLTIDGTPKVVPMHVATDFIVEPEDPDPRGMPVVAADGQVAGTVKDLWVDRAEPRILFFEVALSADGTEQSDHGNGQITDGTEQSDHGNGQITDGTEQSDHGNGQIADGTEQSDHGNGQIADGDTTPNAANPLLPYGFAYVNFGRGQIEVSSVMADQFRHVPRTARSDQITRLEEDRITAYFAGGLLYAQPSRQEPLI